MKSKGIQRLTQRIKWAGVLVSMLYLGVNFANAELIAYWSMDEDEGASGAVALVGGSAFDMNALGGATAGAAGKYGKAWSFDGADETRLQLPPRIPEALTSLNPTDGWTFSGWFNTQVGDSAVATVFSLSLTTAASQEAAIRVNKGTINFLGRHNANDNAIIKSDLAVNDGEWHHVAVTSSTIGGTILYLDGVSVGSSANSVDPSSWHQELHRYEANIGANNDLPAGTEWQFTGLIDEFRIYNHALTPAEIEEIAWIPEANTLSLILVSAFGALAFRRSTLGFRKWQSIECR